LLSLMLLLVGFQLKAQTGIKGTLVLEDGAPAAGAYVGLMLNDSVTIKKYTIVDKDGLWQLNNISKGDYYLNIKYLGYKELLYSISVWRDSMKIDLMLEADDLVLPDVEVKGEAVGITERGDTLKFNLSYFLSKNEVSLGDALNQLPGIEVDENGDIKYAGKKIDKLLIQGKDILDNKHKLATESIRVDQLSGIHVIHNYRDSKDIETKKSGKTAIDVQIKKSEREKWSGQLKLLGGYNKKWLGDWNAFRVSSRLGATFFAKANNTGEQTMSVKDYLGLKGFQILNQLKPNGSMEDIFPKSFRIAPQTTKNLDAILAGGIDYDFSDSKSIKGDFLWAQLNRREEEWFNRNYIGNQAVWSAKQLTESTQPIVSGSVMFKNKISRRLSAKLGLSANYEKINRKNLTAGLYNTHDFDLTNRQAKKEWSFIPEFKINYFPARKLRLRWRVSYMDNQKNKAVELSDIVPFLDLNLPLQNGQYSFEQSIDYRRKKWVSSAGFTYDLKKAWYLGLESSNEIGHYQKIYHAPEESFSGRVQLAQKLNSYKIKLVLDTTKWLIRAGLALVDNHVRLGIAQEEQPLKLSPNLMLKYLFSRNHYILFALNANQEVAPEDYGHSILEALDSRQSRAYDIDWQNSSSRKSLRLSYWKLGLGKGRKIAAAFNYSVVDNPIGMNVVSHADYTQVELIRLPSQTTMSMRLSFVGRVTKRLNAHTSYNLTDSDGFSASQNKISGFHQTRHHLAIGLASKWKKKFNCNVNYAVDLTQQQFGERPNRFVRHIPKVELSYATRKGFLWKSKLSYLQSYAQSLTSKSWKLDTDIIYKLRKNRYRFFIKGRNLLNLVPEDQISVRFNPTFIEEVTYQSFPGYILAGLSRAF